LTNTWPAVPLTPAFYAIPILNGKRLLKRADKLDCEFIATGHYANIRLQDNGRYVISKGKDENKDQSYVLWGVSQKNLARTKFPLGSFSKPEIRQMAWIWAR
jgi:tRNA-specific 2-thiouridylase